MSTRRATKLPEPVIISQFWRNRSGEAVRVQLREYENKPLVDIRVHTVDATGVLQPTAKGISCSVRVLPELAKGLVKALARAREIGLLPGEEK